MRRIEIEDCLNDDQAQQLLEQYREGVSIRYLTRRLKHKGVNSRAIRRFVVRYGYDPSLRQYNVKIY